MDDNPYVGPRAYAADDRIGLYGRTRESNDLLGRLIAQRIVLLYSPSGAGKTSLIESALVPALERQRLSVLPRIRVGLEVGTSVSENRYIQSTLTSLQFPRKALTLPAPAMKHPLVAAVRSEVQRAAPNSGVVLIFDQFEEILTLNSVDIEAKHEFFSEVGEALNHTKAWALFAMREEYLGLLDPFTHHIPTRLANRFRLDLLGPSAARDAICGPARERGAIFTESAVERLVTDLRLTKEMSAEGDARDIIGPVVEPVHLQVVCRRIWDRLQMADQPAVGGEPRKIGLPQLEQAGKVSEALRVYYSELVEKVARNTYTEERRIRLWIGSQLITGGRLRNQVMAGGRRTAGLDNRAIDALAEGYLVRKESRRRLIWYELAHDRLIDPIVEDNAAWFASNPTQLQRVAQIWATHGREKQLLLRGDALEEYDREPGKASDLSDIEREYLETSRRVDKNERTRRLRRRRQVQLVAYALMTVLTSAVAWAVLERRNAEVRTMQILGYVDSLGSNDPRQERWVNEQLLQFVEGQDRVHVHYFAHETDSDKLQTALSSLGYPLEREEGTDTIQSNQVLYGRYVPVNDARNVAMALVAAGLPIKRVSRFRTTRLLESYEIQVLAAPQLAGAPPLPLDSIRLLSNSRPGVGTSIPLEPPQDSSAIVPPVLDAPPTGVDSLEPTKS